MPGKLCFGSVLSVPTLGLSFGVSLGLLEPEPLLWLFEAPLEAELPGTTGLTVQAVKRATTKIKTVNKNNFFILFYLKGLFVYANKPSVTILLTY